MGNQGNAHFPLVTFLEVLFVKSINLCMTLEDIVTTFVLQLVGYKTRRMQTNRVSKQAENQWLIKCYPGFNPVPKIGEGDTRVVFKVCNYLLICPPSFVLKDLREVPMEHGDHWFNSVGKKGIDKVIVIIYSTLVDHIWRTTWQDACPR